MNKLSYGLLSLLSTEQMTGYDLMLKIRIFWNTTHSNIYPLLAELDNDGYIQFTLVEQTGKPDKKVYKITEKGIEALKEWISQPTDSPIIRDEMLLKTYCIQILDKPQAMLLLDERESNYMALLEKRYKRIEELKEIFNGKIETTNSPKFGLYILLHKSISDLNLSIKWCKWVRGLYEKPIETNFFDEIFDFEI